MSENVQKFEDGLVGYAFDEEGELDFILEVTGLGMRVMDRERATAMRDALTKVLNAASDAVYKKAQDRELTLEETIEQIVALPELSQRVYAAINMALYAEPGFSDVEGKDIALDLGLSAQQVGGAVTELVNSRLVWIDKTDVNGKPYHFIHTFAHDEGWVQGGKVVGPH